MYQTVVQDASLPGVLKMVDADLARVRRGEGCRCGGVLHVSNYPRKPRGPCPWGLPAGCGFRLSFTCAKCRKRTTPGSTLFLGRKVYMGAVVVLVATLRHGPTRVRMAVLQAEWGVPKRTVERWCEWWRTAFATSPFWRSAQARFASPIDKVVLPFSLAGAFGVPQGEADALESGGTNRLRALLEFLLPVTTRPWLLAQVS